MALKEHIVKLANGKYRLLSHTGKNLGTFDSHEAAAKHEGEVEYFKHHEEVQPKKLKSFKEFQGDKPDVHNSDQEADSEEGV